MEIINVDIQLHVELVWMFLTPVNINIYQPQQSPCSYICNTGQWCGHSVYQCPYRTWTVGNKVFTLCKYSITTISVFSFIHQHHLHKCAWLLELIIWIGSSRAANQITSLEMSTNWSVSGSGAAAVERDWNWIIRVAGSSRDGDTSSQQQTTLDAYEPDT